MSEELTEKPLGNKLYLTIIATYIGILFVIYGLLPIDNFSKIVLVTITGIFYTNMIFIGLLFRGYLKYLKNKKYYDNTPKLVYSPKLSETITILNNNGDAIISYNYTIKNISGRILNYIGKTIYFDGKFIDNEFKLIVDSNPFNWDDIKTYNDEISNRGRRPIPTEIGFQDQRYIRIQFENGLEKNQKSNITITYKTEGVFKDAFTPEKIDDTAFFIIFPIDEVDLTIELDVPNYRIIEKGFIVEQTRMKIQDKNEETRLDNKHQIPKIPHKNKLIWRFTNPKIAYSYRASFICIEENGN